MILLDGRQIANKILKDIQSSVANLSFKPVFCDVLVGDDPASAQYVRMKAKAAENAGFKFLGANFPASITSERLIAEIKKINQMPNLCGLIIQLPLPPAIDKQPVLDAIEPKIDVDCTGKINTDLFYSGRAYVEFPTAAAVMAILDETKQNLAGKKILVVGFGQLVGKPVTYLLQQRGLSVEVARSKTENIASLIKESDVIISATGKAKLITGDKVKLGSIIIDAGTSESEGGIVGDVDFESVKDVADFISPVPGGVGPVTVAKLLFNVLKVASAGND